jgi:hypothetical protein
MTDAKTQAYIATCVGTERDKLVNTTTQLSTDIGNMCQEFHTMIETTRTQQTVQIKKFISDAVRDTTSYMTASITAPYATKSELNNIFSGFKDEIRLLLQGTHALSMRSASPSMQLQPMGPNGPPYSYSIFPPSGYSSIPGHHPPFSMTEAPASKKQRAGSPLHPNPPPADGELFDATMADAGPEQLGNFPQAANTSLCLNETVSNPQTGGASS